VGHRAVVRVRKPWIKEHLRVHHWVLRVAAARWGTVVLKRHLFLVRRVMASRWRQVVGPAVGSLLNEALESLAAVLKARGASVLLGGRLSALFAIIW